LAIRSKKQTVVLKQVGTWAGRRLVICEREIMEAALEKIRDFADQVHGEQQRKYTPERYIVHPVRVMEMCRAHTGKLPVLAAALLHDVLEDTPVTKERLAQFLFTVMKEEDAKETLRLVVELTDVYTKQRHPRLNRKKRKAKEAVRIEKTSADSQTVKYADIIDNCREIVKHDPDFANVFLRECKGLLTVMPKGNETLRQEAVETVDRCLKEVMRNE
jgi:guanosine-3',5'-bis(diphosphate) 3'-pyrophosphohydrolase